MTFSIVLDFPKWASFIRESKQLNFVLFNSWNRIFPLFSGERPYKCHVPDCGRAFIQLSNLQQHLRNHESQIERLKNRPFHCNICGKGFATESSLRTHNGKVCSTRVRTLTMYEKCINVFVDRSIRLILLSVLSCNLLN